MKINITEDDSKGFIVEFDGADRSIADLIKNKLSDKKEVKFVTVVKDHPEVANPKLVVKAGKNPKALIEKAIDEIQGELKEFEGMLPKK